MALRQEAESCLDQSGIRTTSSNEYSCHFNGNGRDFVLLNKDLIYHHKVIHFHFTTYDVRRGTDIINPGTSRCNIMLLADQVNSVIDSSNLHRFLYAQVLGAYHANVIYTGPGMHDYEPCCFNFLWVRWFEVVNPASSGWEASKLDSVRFPPLCEETLLGFIDPKDVLHGCHIIPAVTILFPRANHLPLFQHGQCPSHSGTFQKHAFACFFLLASIYYLHAFYTMLTIPIPRLSHYAQRPYPMPIPHYLHIASSYELHAHSALFTYTYHMFSHTSTMLSLSI